MKIGQKYFPVMKASLIYLEMMEKAMLIAELLKTPSNSELRRNIILIC